jgi:uncharacterized protein (DUF1015 family)
MLRYLALIMPVVIPFKGILFNPKKVDVSRVTAPPYDIVSPELKEALYHKSPYNIIHIDLGRDMRGDNEEENRYTRASKRLNEWLREGILIEDKEPSFYCYEASYRIDGRQKKLRGFIAAVMLEELGKGRIHPHEMTYSKPKRDRLNILRFCRANISPIFSLYSSKERLASSILERLVKEKALIESKNGEGFIHRLWQIKDKDSIEIIQKELADKDIFIADGHHRYETALEFKEEMQSKGLLKTGTEAFNYVMMFLVNIHDDGLTILPTHRLAHIEKGKKIKELLSPYFEIITINFDGSTIEYAKQDMFRIMKKGRNSLGMFIGDEKAFHVLRFKGQYSEIDSHQSLRNIDVTILHTFIFERLLGVNEFEYEMDPDSVIEKVKNGSFQAAFFLNPTKIEDVRQVALAGQRMPPKSTYFYPKLLTGMVIYKF